MSAEQVRLLYDTHAFDPARAVQEMHALHVPFDDLVGSTGCEARIRQALLARRRVAVVGVSGSGKSSVLSWALGPLVEGVLPVRVPVALGAGAAATDPLAFVNRVIDSVVDQAAPHHKHAVRVAAARAGPQRSAKSRRFEVKPSAWGVSLQLAHEVSQLAQTRETTPYRVMEIAREVLDLVASELVPVLVLDDTDKWINQAGGPHPTRTQFFGQVVRAIAESLGCAAAVAVHEQYLADPAFQEARGFLEEVVPIPSLPGADAGMRILARRATQLALDVPEDAVLHGVLVQAAGRRLFDYYRHRGGTNLRGHFLQVAEMAVVKAREDEAAAVELDHVEAAVAELIG